MKKIYLLSELEKKENEEQFTEEKINYIFRKK